MLKLKIISIGLVGVLLASCSHYGANKADPLRNIASEELVGNETGNPVLRSCIGNLDEELDPVTISNKFKVELVRDDAYLMEYDARDLCASKVRAFGIDSCNFTKPFVEKDGAFKKKFKAIATPYIDETFLKNYRKHILCNKVAACEQKASLDENISSSTLDKIHRVYENNKCDSVTIDVIENKIIKVIPQSDSGKAPEVSSGKNGAQVITTPNAATPTITAPAKDPNAQFCQLRSPRSKCEELSGVCEWVAPSSGFCKARVGSTDPNAKFCQIRSPRGKCEELSGVCEWSEGSSGYCKAR